MFQYTHDEAHPEWLCGLFCAGPVNGVYNLYVCMYVDFVHVGISMIVIVYVYLTLVLIGFSPPSERSPQKVAVGNLIKTWRILCPRTMLRLT